MSTTVRLDDDVIEYIHEHGKFGESHSDVLRRRLLDFKVDEAAVAREFPRAEANGGRKRHPKLFGHSPSALIRWMGVEGWTFAEARRVLDGYGLECVNDITVNCMLAGERQKRGAPAKLTTAQVKELRERR